MGRGKWRGDGGFKSHLEHAVEEGIGRGTRGKEDGLKSQIENAAKERMGRRGCEGMVD